MGGLMRYIIPPLFFIFLAGATFVVKGQRDGQAPVAAPAFDIAPQTATNPREQFALDVLAALGNDQPTPQIAAFMMEWTVAEDGGDGALNRNNPLNTTICGHGAIGAINNDGACGVGHYATYADGVSATVDTLVQSNFSSITAALQANDPDAARAALWASGWAESHYGGGAGWPHVDAPVWGGQATFTPQASTVAPAYLLQGDIGVNVMAALNANGGALRDFTIPPGATWSFGHSIAPISAMGYLPVVCGPAGCNAGGGWCDLSAEYVKVADQLGLESSFPAHAGISNPRFPGILLDENGDGGDLLITNTLAQPVHFQAQSDGGSVTIIGGTL